MTLPTYKHSPPINVCKGIHVHNIIDSLQTCNFWNNNYYPSDLVLYDYMVFNTNLLYTKC